MENEEYIDEKRGFVAETDAVLGIRIWCVGPWLAVITMHTYDVWERDLVYMSEKLHLHIAKVYSKPISLMELNILLGKSKT